MNKRSLIYSLFFLAVGLQAISCTHSQEKENTGQKFCLTDTLKNRVKLDTVKPEIIHKELMLTGKITFNEDRVVKVYPLVGGHVEDLKVELGDYVQKGHTMGLIRSGEIADYENQLISAESNESIAKKNLDVAEDMFKNGLSSEKELVTSRKELQKAEGELSRIKAVLKIYVFDPAKPFYTIKAPISGFIVEKNVTENMEIRADMGNIFTISDLDKVWVMANVYESDIAVLKTGYDVSITTLAYPEKVFEGKIDKIFSIIDPETKVLKVRIVLDNKDYLLKPEMFANIEVKYKIPEKMNAIPEESVIFDKNKHFVMVYHNPCNIETREVEVYDTYEGLSYISKGLNTNDVVISKYQLLVYDAIND